MQNDILYIASQSRARHRLLEFAQIPFKVLQHGSDEVLEEAATSSFQEYVLAIVIHKMQMVQLPDPSQVHADYIFVLTADTLVRSTIHDTILAKPANLEQAVQMLELECKAPVEVVTGCYLAKLQLQNNAWVEVDAAKWITPSIVEFCVDADSIQHYLETFPFVMHCSGAAAIEDYGLSYLKSLNGSFTAVQGLPLYELRLALKNMHFNGARRPHS